MGILLHVKYDQYPSMSLANNHESKEEVVHFSPYDIHTDAPYQLN
jgi:hypothetical protein